MIYFNIEASVPFMQDKFETIWYKGKVFNKKNKSLEMQVDRTNGLFGLSFRWAAKCDHAGLTLELSLLTFHFYGTYSDTRHWNDDEDRWYEYDSAGNSH